MYKEDLIKREAGPTPNGGDYSEVYYMDDDGNIVPEENATRGIIRECKNDGTLISETFILMSGE